MRRLEGSTPSTTLALALALLSFPAATAAAQQDSKQAPHQSQEQASSAPEPLGPPPPPANWTAAEVEAARTECTRKLAGRHVLFEALDPIKEGVCGLPAPIRLRAFEFERKGQLTFAPAPTVSCKLAEALARWAAESLEPEAELYLHTRIVGITTLSAYGCRSRYGDPAQRISQHAFANAIDIGEFVTGNGDRIAVLDNWNSSGERGAFLQGIHEGACKIFGTVLGPEANDSHKNHFHLDMKDRRQPLCDFTPEQLKAREEAKKKKNAPAPAVLKPAASSSAKAAAH